MCWFCGARGPAASGPPTTAGCERPWPHAAPPGGGGIPTCLQFPQAHHRRSARIRSVPGRPRCVLQGRKSRFSPDWPIRPNRSAVVLREVPVRRLQQAPQPRASRPISQARRWAGAGRQPGCSAWQQPIPAPEPSANCDPRKRLPFCGESHGPRRLQHTCSTSYALRLTQARAPQPNWWARKVLRRSSPFLAIRVASRCGGLAGAAQLPGLA